MNPIQSSAAAKFATEMVVSPCIGVCTLGLGDICIGCLRTSAEIGNWSNFSVQERQQVMAVLPERLEILFGK